jgi:hypothetical protein
VRLSARRDSSNGVSRTGDFYGLDINRSLIEASRYEPSLVGLGHKSTHLALSECFELRLFQQKFDYLFTPYVFTHLFANHIIRRLAEVREGLMPEGRFFATVF